MCISVYIHIYIYYAHIYIYIHVFIFMRSSTKWVGRAGNLCRSQCAHSDLRLPGRQGGGGRVVLSGWGEGEGEEGIFNSHTLCA